MQTKKPLSGLKLKVEIGQRCVVLYPNNLKMLEFRGLKCVQFKAISPRNSHSISGEINDEVSALRPSLRAS
ncbi:hypothetical protein SAMN02745132_03387 [Enterovibrio nigricans DSM 22720]|uniref:Uncharacterized protein n=1 Tax=Enterovibrio nigricans DSM 22720 TaxID=1121868 RepID=A0A1T4V7D3_9GAMM|nr:hypothetical protein SAMN02745132_03387 [Enterovibrio nigricans DSM 22720]